MTELAITIFIAAIFIMVGLWTHRDVERGVDSETAWLDHAVSDSRPRLIMRSLSVHSRTTLMFLTGAAILVVGALRFFGVIE